MNVGLTELRPADRADALAYVAAVERATGAKASVATAPTESQLARLESGKLDLVIGEFAEDTPWMSEVAILEPLSQRKVGERTLGLSPVASNGENRWVGVLERQIRDFAAAR